jgi:uncharacterized protein (TIGR03083 family)
MDKAELLDKLQAENARLEKSLSRLTEEQMAAPALPDGWSVKDTIAHLAVWNRRGTTWLGAAARGEAPAIPAPGATWADMDRMNEESHRENLHHPLEEVLAEYRDSYARLVQQLQALTEDAWNVEYLLAGDSESTRVSRIAEWRLRHLVAHAGPIHRFAESVQSGW